MKSDQSVPLSEALERFSDPSDWQELQSLGYCEYQMFFCLGGAGNRETTAVQLAAPARLKERLESRIPGQADCRLSAGKRLCLADRSECQAADHPGGAVADADA